MLGRRVPLPPELEMPLIALFGEGVKRVRIIEHSFFARLHRGAIATTRRRRIYLRGHAVDFFANPNLMLHEYCHVLLQWEVRKLTSLRYLIEWLRRGYWNNCFEVQARRFAQQHSGRFRTLCAAHRKG